MPVRSLGGLDFDTVGVVRADFVQCNDVGGHQSQQHQRNRDHMKAEKTVEGGVADHIIATDQQRQVGADERDRGEQIDDHLRAPVAHLAPGKQVAHEGLGHQAQEDRATEEPDQLARLAVAAVEQTPEHMQVNDDEEGRSAGRVHIAHQPSPGHIAHDVLDRAEGQRRVGLVVHRQENTGHDLDHQYQRRQAAKYVPEVEVLRRVVVAKMVVVELAQRKPVVDPVQQLLCRRRVGGNLFHLSHDVLRYWVSS